MPTAPLIISTWSFSLRANAAAWPALAGGGSSLDAVESACRFAEDDVEVDSVGYGGLPDRDGAVTLDACVMLAPGRCGSVAAVRRRPAVTIARAVMERTNHVTLAGDGADRFADEIGVTSRELLADRARARWESWRRDPRVVDQSRDGPTSVVRPLDDGGGGELFPGAADPSGHDTICSLAIDRSGTLAGGCSTSGMPYKRPGRVGDVGGIGHALYVDPGVGAVTATGSGELVMATCGAFLGVEEMRRGATTLDALRVVLDRVRASCTLEPEHQVGLIAVRPDGTWTTVALRSGFKVVETTERGSVVHDPALTLFEDAPGCDAS